MSFAKVAEGTGEVLKAIGSTGEAADKASDAMKTLRGAKKAGKALALGGLGAATLVNPQGVGKAAASLVGKGMDVVGNVAEGALTGDGTQAASGQASYGDAGAQGGLLGMVESGVKGLLGGDASKLIGPAVLVGGAALLLGGGSGLVKKAALAVGGIAAFALAQSTGALDGIEQGISKALGGTSATQAEAQTAESAGAGSQGRAQQADASASAPTSMPTYEEAQAASSGESAYGRPLIQGAPGSDDSDQAADSLALA